MFLRVKELQDNAERHLAHDSELKRKIDRWKLISFCFISFENDKLAQSTNNHLSDPFHIAFASYCIRDVNTSPSKMRKEENDK